MITNWADPAQIDDDDLIEAPLESRQEEEEEEDNGLVSPTNEFVDETDVVIRTPKKKVWKRGEVKLPIIGCICLTCVFGLYGLMKGGTENFQAANGGATDSANNLSSPQPKPESANPSQGYDPEKSKFKTQAALGTQAQEIQNQKNQAQQQKESSPPSSPPPGLVVRPTTIPVESRAIPPAEPELSGSRNYSSDSLPRYSFNSRPPSVPSIAPKSVASVANPIPFQKTSIAPPEELPQTDSQFISFGGSQGFSQNNQSFADDSNPLGFQQVSFGNGLPQNSSPSLLDSDQVSFLNGDRHLSLGHGEQLQGEILTPAIAEQGGEYLITITKGSGSLPKGSVATARIDQLYGDGLMRSSIQGIVTLQGQKYLVPNGRLQLMAKNGKPLIAKTVKSGGFSIGNLFKSVVIGAVSNAAGRVNLQPRTRFNRADGSVIEDFGQQPQSSLTTNLLQGGLGGLSPLIQSQQAQAQQDFSNSQPSVRFLKAGTQVILQSF